MMTNKEIARSFQFLGNIMELHGENPFKIKSYQSAYITLRKLDRPLSEMTPDEIESIKGVGKAISAKILELLSGGKMDALEKYKQQTPEGVQEMLEVGGMGPKKVQVIWKELGIETIGELLYAVNENRLLELKGFGPKTQEELKRQLEYFNKTKDRFLYASLEAVAEDLVSAIKARLPGVEVCQVGEMRRRCEVVNQIDLLLATGQEPEILWKENVLQLLSKTAEGVFFCRTADDYPVRLFTCEQEVFIIKKLQLTGSESFVNKIFENHSPVLFKGILDEAGCFEKMGLHYIPPEHREDIDVLQKYGVATEAPLLIEPSDIQGVVHLHTNFSDGMHTLEEMVKEAQSLGYGYLGVTDHSKSAFYANGLSVERVLEQMALVDRLNATLASFRIFKGIESDILSDGSLDYEQNILSQFDFVIASVHSNLRMDEDKANKRLLKAIENPYTSILGHPTGRLLLSRQGYPIDHKKIIEACAANKVAIELNASPYRLDIDWRWISYAVEKGVFISINPDAHSKEGIKDIRFGVLAARKAGLSAKNCLTAFNAPDFFNFVKKR